MTFLETFNELLVLKGERNQAISNVSLPTLLALSPFLPHVFSIAMIWNQLEFCTLSAHNRPFPLSRIDFCVHLTHRY